MMRIHNLQKSFDVRLLFGDGKVIKTEVIFGWLKFILIFYKFFQGVAIFHHWSLTASPYDGVC